MKLYTLWPHVLYLIDRQKQGTSQSRVLSPQGGVQPNLASSWNHSYRLQIIHKLTILKYGTDLAFPSMINIVVTTKSNLHSHEVVHISSFAHRKNWCGGLVIVPFFHRCGFDVRPFLKDEVREGCWCIYIQSSVWFAIDCTDSNITAQPERQQKSKCKNVSFKLS